MVRESAGLARRNEPVSVSVPLAAGRAGALAVWRLSDPTGMPVRCQTRVLASWPDGRVKWLQCTFLANTDAHEIVVYGLSASVPEQSPRNRAEEPAKIGVVHDPLDPAGGTTASINVDTGPIRYVFYAPHTASFLASFEKGRFFGGMTMSLFDANDFEHQAVFESATVEESGPLRVRIRQRGSFASKCKLQFTAVADFYAASSRARFSLTIENRSRARHHGGFWDLGDSGSYFFRGLEIRFNRSADHTFDSTNWSESPAAPSRKVFGEQVEIYQDSSGGENWRSRNHINHQGNIPRQFQGFRVRHHPEESHGLRVSPTMFTQSAVGGAGVAPVDFWQKCPAALTGDRSGICWQPFPRQFKDLHEFQAGEQSTHVAWVDFTQASDQDLCQRLAWAHVPLEVRCAPQVYAESGAVPYLPDEDTKPRPELTTMLHEALEGPRNFFLKREVVDEYGWRNYGDTWADHEEAYYPGPHKPIISHYNNQFDILYGFLVEYLRSGDRRWWELADPLARHVMDIDIYHTDRDKAAYNGGLFWPTNHYYDAGTSTHRSMGREMSLTGTTGVGGGPGSEHNFTSGLLLYHYLTGDERARETVVGLADWVIAMDDGEQHFLSLLSGKPTGVATLTTVPGYNGPGRGPANSVTALTDGYMATGNEKYLDKADELIRRTIHPRDVIAQRELDNFELRWSYTMHLQALMRYLAVITLPPPLSESEGSFLPGRAGIARYIKQSVLHYARWMAEHETFSLDSPEKLEFPTETWAAQELRKGVVLLMAARLADPAEGATFQLRGKYFLDRAWQSLLSFPTRAYTRPLALVLGQGYLESALCSGTSPLPPLNILDGPFEPGEPAAFVSQKDDIRRSLKSPLGLARMFARSMSPVRWAKLLSRSWFAERVRSALHRNSRPTRPS